MQGYFSERRMVTLCYSFDYLFSLISRGGIVASQLLFSKLFFSSCSVAQSGPTLCDPTDFPVLYSLLEFAQTHVH